MRRAMRALGAWLARAWFENHATQAVMNLIFSACLVRSLIVAKGPWWTGFIFYLPALYVGVDGLRHLKEYLWEGVVFRITSVVSTGGGGGGGDKKPEVARPILPKTKDEARCN